MTPTGITNPICLSISMTTSRDIPANPPGNKLPELTNDSIPNAYTSAENAMVIIY